MIDVMATEGLWMSPSGNTPTSTLYAALAHGIKDLGKGSPFRKTERGKFEAKIVVKVWRLTNNIGAATIGQRFLFIRFTSVACVIG
jgi:hypothetical protein